MMLDLGFLFIFFHILLFNRCLAFTPMIPLVGCGPNLVDQPAFAYCLGYLMLQHLLILE